MREINFMIMTTTLDLINQDLVGLERNDPTRLRLVEIRPRSESFADMNLSASISPNDPDAPGTWLSEQIGELAELGGGMAYRHRFTLDLQLFYSELGIPRDKALESALIILARIQTAILNDRTRYRKLTDDFGRSMYLWDKAVVKQELRPAGSEEEVFLKAKMWLEFICYQEIRQ